MENMQLQEKESPEKNTKKLASFLKKHIKPIIIIFAVLLLVLAATTTISSMKAHKVKAQLENKIFVTDSYNDDRWMNVYAFKDGKIAIEEWFLDSLERAGDFTAFDHKYKIVASIFSEKINIMAKYPHGWVEVVAVYLDEVGVVQHYKYTKDMPDWREITLEDAKKLRTQKMCDHDFEEPIIIRVATCSQPGEAKKVCEKCELEQTYATYEPHNYVNSICSVCGSKKIAENADIGANTTPLTDSLSFADYMQWLKDYAEKEGFLGVTNLSQSNVAENPNSITYSCDYDENLVSLNISTENEKVALIYSTISPYTIIDKGIASDMSDAKMMAYSLALEPIVGVNDAWDHSWHLQQLTEAPEQGNDSSLKRTYTKNNWTFTVIIGNALVSVSAINNNIS